MIKITPINTGNLNFKAKKDVNSQVSKKNNKKAFVCSSLVGLSLLGIATICTKNVKKLNDIQFKNGVALLPNGKKYTGKICDNLKNGDKITLIYKNGEIQKSSRSGKCNFVKTFKTYKLSDSKIINTTHSIDGKLVKTASLLTSENGKLLSYYDSLGNRFTEQGFGGEKCRILKKSDGLLRTWWKDSNQIGWEHTKSYDKKWHKNGQLAEHSENGVLKRWDESGKQIK